MPKTRDDPRGKIFEVLQSAEIRVRPFTGLIFVCGGAYDVRAASPSSLRQALVDRLHGNEALGRRIRMAEDIQDWSERGIYKDLVTFEGHLAELASVIVLILESAGSIAELGLFSAIREFQKRLLVVVDEKHFDEVSFIKCGPLQFLEDQHGNRAEVYSWLAREGSRVCLDFSSIEGVVPDLTDSVVERASIKHGGGKFDRSSWLHRVLLLLELIELCSMLELNEAHDYLSLFVDRISLSEVRQMLFVLERVELVRLLSKGGMRLYVKVIDGRTVDFRSPSTQFDRDRAKFEIADFYKDADRKRYRAIQSYGGEG